MSASHEVEGVVVCRNQLSRCRKFWDSRERVGEKGEWIDEGQTVPKTANV